MLGAAAAERLGIDRIYPGERIWVGADPADPSAGSGSTSPASSTPPCSPPRSTPRCWSASPPRRSTSASTATPPQIYLRAHTDQVNAVHDLLAATANPENPNQVTVSQPSDALVAQADAKGALNSLFLGLGAVSLLVGAIGVANIMVIAVLERRSEIGLRRALGATKGHIRIQFLTEAMLLAALGRRRRRRRSARPPPPSTPTPNTGPPSSRPWPGPAAWPPPSLIGALAGLLPAIRAARMSPTQALWSM